VRIRAVLAVFAAVWSLQDGGPSIAGQDGAPVAVAAGEAGALPMASRDRSYGDNPCMPDRDIGPLLGKLDQMAQRFASSSKACEELEAVEDLDSLTPEQDDAYAACHAIFFLESYQRSRTLLCDALSAGQDALTASRDETAALRSRLLVSQQRAEDWRLAYKDILGMKGERSGRKWWVCTAGGSLGYNLVPILAGTGDKQERLPGYIGAGFSCGVPIFSK